MMMQVSLDVLTHSLESWKFWITFLSMFVGVVIGGYKTYQWIKGIREEDFPEVKASLATVSQKIEDTSAAQLRSTEFQTSSVVRELQELRDDFRAYFNPPAPLKMVPVRSKAATKRVYKKAPKTTAKKKAVSRAVLAPARKK